MKVRVIEITGGGEPLMRKDILTLMEEIKRYKIFGRLITNGTLFTERMIEKLIKIEWNEIVFSLDAPERGVNDYLRGESFDRIIKAIKAFQIKKIDAELEKPGINIHMVLCNKNFHLLPQMFEFAYNLNCKNLLIEPIVLLATKTGAGKDLLFQKKDEKKLLNCLQEAIKVAYKYNFQTNVDKLESELIKSTAEMKGLIGKEGKEEKNPWLALPCYLPFYRMIIRPWGVVGACCMFDNVGENINQKSLEEIWFGEYFEKMRKEMLRRKLPEFCYKCNPSQVQENRKIRAWMKKLQD